MLAHLKTALLVQEDLRLTPLFYCFYTRASLQYISLMCIFAKSTKLTYLLLLCKFNVSSKVSEFSRDCGCFKLIFRYVVIGAGKTGMDALLQLLDSGVSSDSIIWVVSQDCWYYNR